MSWWHIPWPKYVNVFMLSLYPNARFAWSTSIDYICLQYKLCGFPHNTLRRVGVELRKSWGNLETWGDFGMCEQLFLHIWIFAQSESESIFTKITRSRYKMYTTNILTDISATPVVSMGIFWPWHWCMFRAWRRSDNAFHRTFTELIARVCWYNPVKSFRCTFFLLLQRRIRVEIYIFSAWAQYDLP